MARPATVPAYRNYATYSEPDLKTTFKEVLPAKRELLTKVKAMGGKTIGEVKVENTIGGMRYYAMPIRTLERNWADHDIED
jgi:citrate synthase